MTDSRKPAAPVDSNVRKPSERERNWEKTQLRPALEKSPERSSEFTTISGHPIERLYTQADLSEWDAERDLGVPGEPPLSGRISPMIVRRPMWALGPFAGFGSAEGPKSRFRYLLSQGQN